MYMLQDDEVTVIEKTTFKELNMKECDLEEILRKNIDMLCDDDESMLIVGQQVRNASGGRSDLTAVDNNGNVVLIEIKRDVDDIVSRKEAFEFQAIRYAASCATIKQTDELVRNVMAPYVEKYKMEFQMQGDLTAFEMAARKLQEFLQANDVSAFNRKQRIILAASDFDEQTLSAVAWLNSNQVDISCYQMCPYKIGEKIIIDMKKLLPVPEYGDFYVDIVGKNIDHIATKSGIKHRSLPRIKEMLESGIVKAGDVLLAKGRPDEAILQEDGLVLLDGKKMSMQAWLKDVFQWSAVETYAFVVHKEQAKTLKQLRQEYMDEQDKDRIERATDEGMNDIRTGKVYDAGQAFEDFRKGHV